jgi:hypothetical protein
MGNGNTILSTEGIPDERTDVTLTASDEKKDVLFKILLDNVRSNNILKRYLFQKQILEKSDIENLTIRNWEYIHTVIENDIHKELIKTYYPAIGEETTNMYATTSLDDIVPRTADELDRKLDSFRQLQNTPFTQEDTLFLFFNLHGRAIYDGKIVQHIELPFDMWSILSSLPNSAAINTSFHQNLSQLFDSPFDDRQEQMTPNIFGRIALNRAVQPHKMLFQRHEEKKHGIALTSSNVIPFGNHEKQSFNFKFHSKSGSIAVDKWFGLDEIQTPHSTRFWNLITNQQMTGDSQGIILSTLEGLHHPGGERKMNLNFSKEFIQFCRGKPFCEIRRTNGLECVHLCRFRHVVEFLNMHFGVLKTVCILDLSCDSGEARTPHKKALNIMELVGKTPCLIYRQLITSKDHIIQTVDSYRGSKDKLDVFKRELDQILHVDHIEFDKLYQGYDKNLNCRQYFDLFLESLLTQIEKDVGECKESNPDTVELTKTLYRLQPETFDQIDTLDVVPKSEIQKLIVYARNAKLILDNGIENFRREFERHRQPDTQQTLQKMGFLGFHSFPDIDDIDHLYTAMNNGIDRVMNTVKLFYGPVDMMEFNRVYKKRLESILMTEKPEFELTTEPFFQRVYESGFRDQMKRALMDLLKPFGIKESQFEKLDYSSYERLRQDLKATFQAEVSPKAGQDHDFYINEWVEINIHPSEVARSRRFLKIRGGRNYTKQRRRVKRLRTRRRQRRR